MYAKSTVVKNQTGLHARPASDFVKAAGKFNSNIKISKAGVANSANAKSIVYVLSLGLVKGSEVEISAEGEDERDAVETLIALVDSFEE